MNQYAKLENETWYTGRCDECSKRTNSKVGYTRKSKANREGGLVCPGCANKPQQAISTTDKSPVFLTTHDLGSNLFCVEIETVGVKGNERTFITMKKDQLSSLVRQHLKILGQKNFENADVFKAAINRLWAQ